jgi:hypothetical protein
MSGRQARRAATDSVVIFGIRIVVTQNPQLLGQPAVAKV